MWQVEKSKTIHEKALVLCDLDEEFTLIKINDTFKLKSKWFGDLTSSPNKKIPHTELGFIKRVKNHIIKNDIYGQFIDKLYYPDDIKYVDVIKHKESVEFTDVVEIDIDEAYFRTGFLLGAIPLDLYEEGRKSAKKISKIGRLISLGSLAKKEVHYTYRGYKLIREKVIRSQLTENIWYSICKRVADLMHEAKKIAGDDFLLYWVDGIYIKNNPESIEKIKKMFSQFEYDVKTKENLTVSYKDDKVVVLDPLEPEHPRPFFFSKKKAKTSYFTDTQLKETALEFSKIGAMDHFTDFEDEHIE